MASYPNRQGEIPPAVLIAAGVIVLIIIIIGAFVLLQDTKPKTQNNDTIACPALYDPVCGTDNKTYSNSCIANFSNITIAYNGTCIISGNCTETDSGKDIFHNGDTEKDNESESDSCIDSTSINEFYCLNNSIVNETLECEAGYECDDGACIIERKESGMCTDSDGGEDNSTKGTVLYGGKNYTDTCTMINQVKEYYCQNNSMKSTNFVCKLGFQCYDGRCVEMPQVCSDSDSGSFPAKKGTTVVTKGSDTLTMEIDYCLNQSYVRENYCANSSIVSEAAYCGNGSVCADGECFYLSCDDSDGGQNLMKKGLVTKGSNYTTDSCDGTYNVKEYYCKDGNIESVVSTCPSSFWCLDGQCITILCADTDNGKDYYNIGAVTKGSDSFKDYCKNSDMLVEYYCDNNAVNYEEVSCGYPVIGQCVSGYCKIS